VVSRTVYVFFGLYLENGRLSYVIVRTNMKYYKKTSPQRVGQRTVHVNMCSLLHGGYISPDLRVGLDKIITN